MKFLVVISTAALLFSANVYADYEFQMKNLGCDYCIESIVQSSAAKNVTNVLTTVHGNFRKITTETILDNGNKYSTETIMRPDLASRQGYALEVTYSSGVGTTIREDAIQPRGGITVYKHREPATFNGHSCFKYYNVPGNSIFADADGFIWGSEETNDEGEVSTITYKSYDTSKVLAGQFTLNSDIRSPRTDKVVITPDAAEYDKECRSESGEKVYMMEVPKINCDIKMMTETDIMTENGNTITTQTTITAHGSYILETNTDTVTWQTNSLVLIRPDQGKSNTMATAYAFDYTSRTCTKTAVQLKNVAYGIDNFVFTHRDEEFYNGFVCYKYYNDSSAVYYMEKSGGLPRGIIIEGEFTTRFVYYDFSSINSTTFVLTGTELEACGITAGEEINSKAYDKGCNPLVLEDSSTIITTASSIKKEPEQSSLDVALVSTASTILTLSPVMIIMVLIALIA